jgi:N-methylhydantoinase A
MAGLSRPRKVRVGVDIGGTFTDLVLATHEERLFVGKVSSTPHDPGDAVVTGIAELLARVGVRPADVGEIVHGTTVGSNTILQRVGARTGLITTRGFRDVLEIGRIRTPGMFDLTWEKPEPLVHRRHRLEVEERVAADGSIVTPLDAAGVLAAGERLIGEGIQAIAICFINSHANPAHEAEAARILRERFPSLRVTASHEVLPEMKEYERTSTTVVNAYLLPEMQTYLEKLSLRLKAMGIEAPLQVVASNGGTMGARLASRTPAFVVASGPAGGVTGAAALTRSFDFGDVIVFDMGGTTAKASIIEGGQPAIVSEYEFRDGITSPSRFIKGGGYMLKVPAVDIAEVGAGGGSIAAIDAGGLLHVGPASAGAHPGPACYGLGNDRPTVTDANVCLGFLNPTTLAGGSLSIHKPRAEAAMTAHIAKPLGLPLIEAAHGVRQIANVNMARAIRSVTVERGKDPRDMAMIAFGGGGPLHAVDVARLLGISKVIAPVMSGVFSAAGMLSSDVEHNFVRSTLRPLSLATPEWLAERVRDLAADGRAVLQAEGYDGDAVELRFAADLRYIGQSSELAIPFDPAAISTNLFTDLAQRFNAAYQATYGYHTDEAIEIANLRLAAVGRAANRLRFRRSIIDAAATAGSRGTRRVSFERGQPEVEVALLARCDVDNVRRSGPVIIESYDTTIVVPPGCSYAADEIGNIIIDIDGEPMIQ